MQQVNKACDACGKSAWSVVATQVTSLDECTSPNDAPTTWTDANLTVFNVWLRACLQAP